MLLVSSEVQDGMEIKGQNKSHFILVTREAESFIQLCLKGCDNLQIEIQKGIFYGNNLIYGGTDQMVELLFSLDKEEI